MIPCTAADRSWLMLTFSGGCKPTGKCRRICRRYERQTKMAIGGCARDRRGRAARIAAAVRADCHRGEYPPAEAGGGGYRDSLRSPKRALWGRHVRGDKPD